MTPIFLLLFLAFIPAASPLSFNMSPITNSDTIHFNLSGDAYIDGGIQITTNDRFKALNNRLGRATFKEPLHLWDNATGNLTDFSSNFSFIINSNGNQSYADGLAFFMAPLDSTLRNWSIGGGSLGLGNITTSSSSSDSFVAVEFDTFLNVFDPFYKGAQWSYPTVGININNMTSVNAIPWENDATMGFKNDAWIRYDAVSKMLVVEFTGRDGNTTQRGQLSYEIDLRHYLPEYVMVGFSAATGQWFEQNIIESWSFSSTLQLNQSSEPEPQPQPQPQPQRARGRNKKGLIFGLSAGLSLLVLASGFAVFAVWRKSKYQGLEEDRVSDSSMDNEFGEGTGPRKFSYNELVAATYNFAEKHKLGEGGFGCVYRGFLAATNTDIAVKRVPRIGARLERVCSRGQDYQPIGAHELGAAHRLVPSTIRAPTRVRVHAKWELGFSSLQAQFSADMGNATQNCTGDSISSAVSARGAKAIRGAQRHKGQQHHVGFQLQRQAGRFRASPPR